MSDETAVLNNRMRQNEPEWARITCRRRDRLGCFDEMFLYDNNCYK